MKIFLTEGNGFLGKNLCRALPGQGHELTVLVRPGTGTEDFGRDVKIFACNPSSSDGQKGSRMKCLRAGYFNAE